MTVQNVLTMLMGLVLFLFGMNLMGEALEKRAGNKLKNILATLTSSKIKGFLLGLAVTSLNLSLGMFGGNYNAKTYEEIESLEDEADKYEDAVGTYLVKFSASNLTPENSSDVTKLLHTIGDLEVFPIML